MKANFVNESECPQVVADMLNIRFRVFLMVLCRELGIDYEEAITTAKGILYCAGINQPDD